MPVTVAAIELGTFECTLYRDMAEPTAPGTPIVDEVDVGYVLRHGLFLPPLMLKEDEIEAVVLGLVMSISGAITCCGWRWPRRSPRSRSSSRPRR